ncbi:MAG: S-layer homology domain-containing protein [Bacillota bacterium]|jgi:hypothetical protein
MIFIVKAEKLHIMIAALFSVFLVLIFSPIALADADSGSEYRPSTWALSRINIAETAGLISDDFSEKQFTDSITRQDFCLLLINSCRIFKYPLPKVPQSHPFTDSQDKIAEQAYALGLTTGTAPGIFGPDLPLTREMATVMMGKLRLLFQTDAELMDEQQAAKILQEYAKDSNKIFGWSERYMADAYSRGIIAGTGNGNLSPKSNITREQAVVLMLNLLAYCDASRIKAAGVKECVLPAPSGMKISQYYYHGDVNLSWGDTPLAAAYDVRILKNGTVAYATRTKAHNIDFRTNPKEDHDTIKLDNIFGSDRQTVKAVIEVVPVDSKGNPSLFSLTREFTVLPKARERETTQSDRSDIRLRGDIEVNSFLTSISVPVWQLSSGTKKTATITLTVHKDVAEYVKKIFAEIYNGKEKFPIKSCSGYSNRGGTSQHNYGLAIDINPNENYFIGRDGTIKAGSFWMPGKNPYSIPADGDVVRAFKKYGWHWSPDMNWSNGADYMHFSLKGT